MYENKERDEPQAAHLFFLFLPQYLEGHSVDSLSGSVKISISIRKFTLEINIEKRALVGYLLVAHQILDYVQVLSLHYEV